MLWRMQRADTEVVDLLRAFAEAHRRLRALAAQYAKGELQFAEVRALVGGTEAAVLFRLKEHSHALYRRAGDAAAAVDAGALFDLAAGSLFHEAMKFREGFYQLNSYAPKLAALKTAGAGDGDGDGDGGAQTLRAELQKILQQTQLRVADSLREMEALLSWSAQQIPALLQIHKNEGPLARYLVEQGAALAALLNVQLEALLARVHGSAAAARAAAAHSYLAGGFYKEAAALLAGAAAGDAALRCYAEGMAAYESGRFAECAAKLGRWLDAPPSAETLRRLGPLAQAALSRIAKLEAETAATASIDLAVCKQAAALAARIGKTHGWKP